MDNEQNVDIEAIMAKWANRLNKYEYFLQSKGGKVKVKQFSPNVIACFLIDDVLSEYQKGERTAESAMSALWIAEVREELNKCMDAGF